MAKRCNRDCFNCIYDDCIIKTASKKEREEQNKRDINFTDFGVVRFQRPTRARHRGRRY